MTEVLAQLRERKFEGRLGQEFQVTASAGIARQGFDGATTRILHATLHELLQRAKAAGADRVLASEQSTESSATLDVLVVDDDTAVGRVLVHTLQTRGYRVEWLQNGSEALEPLESGAVRPRLVILDISLPGMDGLTLLRRLQQHANTSNLRIMMLTAGAAEAEVLQSLEWGAFDHVAKPFSLPVLMQRIRRALET